MEYKSETKYRRYVYICMCKLHPMTSAMSKNERGSLLMLLFVAVQDRQNRWFQDSDLLSPTLKGNVENEPYCKSHTTTTF